MLKVSCAVRLLKILISKNKNKLKVRLSVVACIPYKSTAYVVHLHAVLKAVQLTSKVACCLYSCTVVLHLYTVQRCKFINGCELYDCACLPQLKKIKKLINYYFSLFSMKP